MERSLVEDDHVVFVETAAISVLSSAPLQEYRYEYEVDSECSHTSKSLDHEREKAVSVSSSISPCSDECCGQHTHIDHAVASASHCFSSACARISAGVAGHSKQIDSDLGRLQ